MKKYFVSAFSLNMVRDNHKTSTVTLSPEEAAQWVDANPDAVHAIGHAGTASLVSAIIQRDARFNRDTLYAVPGDEVLVAQYTGDRLEEGAKELPAGAVLMFRKVQILPA